MDTNNETQRFDVVTVTLNPAIDNTVTIPRFTPGAVNRVAKTRTTPGGKGVNVASALADYGCRIAATGFLGSENSGLFDSLFVRKQIANRFVRIAGPTRTGIKITDPILKQTTDINFPGLPPTRDDCCVLDEHLAGLCADWFVLAGSIPPGISEAIYRDLVATLKTHGCKVAVDASGEALRHAIDATPDFIKPNRHELEMLVGNRLESTAQVIRTARTLVEKGITLVVVSLGNEGACFVTGTDALIARPPDIDVNSTVGAGDAMVAGIVAARLQQLPLADCARLSTGFAIHALTHSEPGTASRDSINSAMETVKIEIPVC